MYLEILQPFKPLFSADVHDQGGKEVVGWLYCPRWKVLLGWLRLLIDRNMNGCIPYKHNPEPWPGYYRGIIAAENSHLSRPWMLEDFLKDLPPVTRHCIDWAGLIAELR